MVIKSLFAVCCASIILSVNAVKILPECKPWQSQGLTPVKIKLDKKQAPLILSKNGKAMVKLVVPAKTDRAYYTAIAKIMQKYLNKTTGADFEIVKGVLKSGKGIFIGPCEDTAVKNAFDTMQKQQAESFLVKSFSKGIILTGND